MTQGMLGVMIDCSRNAVMSTAAVKRYIDLLQKMGYNALMLYTEDTYEVEGHPLFGYLRGQYSAAELKELVAYGEAHGVELIPCVQTLAHLPQLFRWSEYNAVRDLKDILLADDEATYALIDDMFRSLRACFCSRRIHIGMDEAHDVGLGKYFEKHGATDRFQLLSRHLGRVAQIAEKYGFTPMMWSDMFFRLAAGGEYFIHDPALITEEITALVPPQVELVYWDYYSGSVAHYDRMIEAHKKFSSPLWFAGRGFLGNSATPRNKMAEVRCGAALESCVNNGVGNVLMTLWGDDGGECSPFAALPALWYAAERYRGVTDREQIRQGFFDLCGVSYDDFLKLDLPAERFAHQACEPSNDDKLMLYNDPFLGIYDGMVTDIEAVCARWESAANTLAPLGAGTEYAPLFETEAALCRLLAIKYPLGVNTRAAYQAGDRAALAAAVQAFSETERRLENYYEAYRALWFTEKKGHGFDVQDIRLGGLARRLRSCRERLEQYLAGEVERIEELEETILPRQGYVCRWAETVTPNELSAYFLDVLPF